MFYQYLEDLENSIQWAHYEDDIDVLFLAKQKMENLVGFVSHLPTEEQNKIYQFLESLLPMEWPLWMEACRYLDHRRKIEQSIVYH